MHTELPNLITLLAQKFPNSTLSRHLVFCEDIFFSLLIVAILSLVTYLASRRASLIPKGLQNAVELFVQGTDNFVCGILGEKGRRYVPFIGTLFIYILFMNLFGLIPLLKSSTSSWSTTLALAICVFLYVQYTALRQKGFLGYLDHMLGKPRGIIALSVFIPMMMFILHVVSELVRPISLSLRLRSNIWGDDMLLGVLSGFGIKGVPLIVFSMFLAIIASVVQALVFGLLTTIYFALALTGEEDKE